LTRLKIHYEKIDAQTANTLCGICPFASIRYENDRLEIDSGCTLCGVCVRDGPEGAITLENTDEKPEKPGEYEPERTQGTDKGAWRGIAVYAEYRDGAIHPVVWELLGKAGELATVNGEPVYAVLIGSFINDAAKETIIKLRECVDELYVYDHPEFANFRIEPYANAFEDFVLAARPSAVLVGATQTGRSLAPRVAARFRTGLTADCTMLEMRDNTDLVQIRPAFGGNLMAQIITARHRPQFCTVRYKIFSSAKIETQKRGTVLHMTLAPEKLRSGVRILKIEDKPSQIDISEAKIIVAAGRGFRKKEDLALAEELAARLHAQLACTRPLIENGWFDTRRQIGLSGRTVGADLIITVGVSGSVQFAAGMKGCGCIISINSDPAAPIFDIAHYAIVGDLYEILPALIAGCKEE